MLALTDLQGALDEAIFRDLPRTHAHPDLEAFYTLLRDYPSRGGKRLRGTLLLLSTAAHGAPWRRGLNAAAALELFQNWVLIHDDIEDDSEDRRGRPALHRTAGVPVALNVGDALHIYMWRTLLRELGDGTGRAEQHDPLDLPRLLHTFEWMISRTAEGQHLDLTWVAEGRFEVSEAAYLEMVQLKTAYYTVVGPLELGALCAGAEPDPRLRQAGEDLGVAFQIRDDVLNLMADVSYGKEFAGDLFEAKRTLVLAHFFAHAPLAEADEVRRVLAQPRGEKTAAEVMGVLERLKRGGSLAYAQEVAEARAARGLETLQGALAGLPNQEAAQAILRLLSEAASRRT